MAIAFGASAFTSFVLKFNSNPDSKFRALGDQLNEQVVAKGHNLFTVVSLTTKTKLMQAHKVAIH